MNLARRKIENYSNKLKGYHFKYVDDPIEYEG